MMMPEHQLLVRYQPSKGAVQYMFKAAASSCQDLRPETPHASGCSKQLDQLQLEDRRVPGEKSDGGSEGAFDLAGDCSSLGRHRRPKSANNRPCFGEAKRSDKRG